MKSTKQLLLMSLIVVALSACQGSEPASNAQQSSSAEQAPAGKPPEPVAGVTARSLIKNFAVDTVNTQEGVGQIQDGVLTGTGKAGYLMFGPYVPLAAGTYKLQINGNVEDIPPEQAVTLDVASGEGTVVHGQTAVTEVGELPSFDVTLAEDVTNVEVRIAVPEGAKVTVRSYELSPKS